MNSLTEAMVMLIYDTYIWVQKLCVGLFNMACVILNQGWIRANQGMIANQRMIDRAIRYFAMGIWYLAMIVLVMITLLIGSIVAFTVLYLVFSMEMRGPKMFVIY